MEEIGLFQLENLSSTPARFLFYDLRADTAPSPKEIERVLARAVKVNAGEVIAHLRQQKVPTDFPIILLCETGKLSAQVAGQLENADFKNVYVVAGGFTGLLAEL